MTLDYDDEVAAIDLVHRSLMKLKPGARRRVVRYMVERHVSTTEPEPAAAPGAPEEPLSEAASVAAARRQLTEQRA